MIKDDNYHATDIKSLQNLLQGERLKSLLKRRGITRYQLAKETGINYRTLQYWETGTVVPSEELARKVGMTLGLISESQDEYLSIKNQVDEIKKKLQRLGIE